MKNRIASTLPLLFAASAFLFLACSKQSGTSTTDTGAPGSATATSPSPATDQPPNQSASPSPVSSQAAKTGWWIRINPNGTTAQSITFQIGTSKLQREEWRVWNAGEPAEFDVPGQYLQAPRLYVRGNVTPIGKFATLCVMYKDRGVEHMSFDDDDSETMLQTEIDYKCR
jgi:hypothetical protein